MPRPSNIAVITNSKGQDCQTFLARTAAEWRSAGANVVGVLAENYKVEGGCSAGFVRDIASGKRFSIHLSTPPVGTTCHLDAAGLEEACDDLLPQIISADVVILSKF